MKNVGNVDKIIRIIIGVVLLSLLFVLNGNIKYLGLIGIIPFLTAVFGYCPLYSMFGIKTCKIK